MADQVSKKLSGVDLTTIGVQLWLVPQISERWPQKIAGQVVMNDAWLSRPGIASDFTPRVGMAQTCTKIS